MPLAKITASDGRFKDYFGYSVAISGSTVVVGAIRADDNGIESGSAYVFDASGTQHAKLTASDGAANDRFGISVAIDGSTIVVGAGDADDDNGSDSGSAYVFDASGTQLAKLNASDGAASDFFLSAARYLATAWAWRPARNSPLPSSLSCSAVFRCA